MTDEQVNKIIKKMDTTQAILVIGFAAIFLAVMSTSATVTTCQETLTSIDKDLSCMRTMMSDLHWKMCLFPK